MVMGVCGVTPEGDVCCGKERSSKSVQHRCVILGKSTASHMVYMRQR